VFPEIIWISVKYYTKQNRLKNNFSKSCRRKYMPEYNNIVIIIRRYSFVYFYVNLLFGLKIQWVERVSITYYCSLTVPIVSLRAFKDFNLRSISAWQIIMFSGNILYGVIYIHILCFTIISWVKFIFLKKTYVVRGFFYVPILINYYSH